MFASRLSSASMIGSKRLISSVATTVTQGRHRMFNGGRALGRMALFGTAFITTASCFSLSAAAKKEEAPKEVPKKPETEALKKSERVRKHNPPLTPQEEEYLKLVEGLPIEKSKITMAPNVPPPITRQGPARVIVDMNSTAELLPISPQHKYPFWTYNGGSPGPFIRVRVGDVLEVHYTNEDSTGIAHNIDFHAVTGPGGGAPCLLAEQGETKVGIFKMLQAGLYVYHCAAGPVPQHVQNGMYGLILVEPREGLPKVDKEFYVMQGEFYADVSDENPKVLEPSFAKGLAEENPMYVVFNGRAGSLTENPLMVDQGDRVRLFVGNGGPNLISSFHVIGGIFDKVYREGDLVSPPARNIQTTLIPAGGSTVVEFDAVVPGNYTIVDHSIFRIEKGAIGFIKCKGRPRPDVYDSVDIPTPCPGCKLHN